jgi:8-oxo-dGTP pyrophosphatase MutT (NUDIX family)
MTVFETNTNTTKINERERSYLGAGIILTHHDGTALRFLLLEGAKTGIWSFPKGHGEKKDGYIPFRTAVRESEEETGLVAAQDFAVLSHPFHLGNRWYWIGIVRSAEVAARVRLSPKEHCRYAWLTVSEMDTLPSNADVRSWIQKTSTSTVVKGAISFLSSMQPTHCSAPVCIVS